MLSLFCKTLNPTFPLRVTSSHSFSLPRSTRTIVRNMSSGSRMFQLKLDPLTGNSEWVVIEESDTPEQTPTPLLATTSYLDMLNDSPRNRAFREAIDKTVTKPCHVLDIGAGTGLLSMMAARAMGPADSASNSDSKGMVTACESYLPMVKLMRKVLRANGIERGIRIINKRSDELEVGRDIASRADVLVSEILDSELLGEGLIPTLQHAHDNLLVESPKTVPYRATIFGQLVESKDLWKMHDLFNNEEKALDTIHLVPKGMDTIICVKHQQFPMHCDAISEGIKLLSEPFKIFDFDFWKRPDSSRETELLIKATKGGIAHAIISWWLLQLDREGTVFYSTGPKWIHCPSDVKDPSLSCLSVRKDEYVHLHAVHTDVSLSYIVKTQSQNMEVRQYKPSAQDCQLFLSPERIAIYGDNNWRCSMLKAINNALKQKASPLCIVADDSIFLTIAVGHLARASNVISLFPGLQDKGEQYLQAVAASNDYSMDCIKVLKKRNSTLTMQDTHHKKVDLLIAEPFYYGSDSVLPWQNLRFWKERTTMDNILSKDVVVMPCKGLLKACAMSLPDLWRSRRCLKDIEGFDHSVVNSTLGACGDLPAGEQSPCLPFFIWQCGETKKLSEIITIMEFNFQELMCPCSEEAQFEFTESGICHGLVFWIDWVMDAGESTVISTGPEQRYWKQGVKLLEKPVTVQERGSISNFCRSTKLKVSFDPSVADLSVELAFV
nr:protein arginine N-methyltransferase 1.6 [Ipomoea trifida]